MQNKTLYLLFQKIKLLIYNPYCPVIDNFGEICSRISRRDWKISKIQYNLPQYNFPIRKIHIILSPIFSDQNNLLSLMSNQQEKIVLHYPAIRGTIQPIRNLLIYLELNWEEVFDRSSNLTEGQFNSGTPRLVQGDFELTEVTTIFRHIARNSDRLDLLGLTPQSRASINEFMFKFTETRKKMIKGISDAALLIWQNKGDASQIKMSLLKNFIESQCKIVKTFLTKFMKSRSWVMGYLTMADFFFYEICFYLTNFLGSVLKNHIIYRNIAAFKKMFESQQFFINHQQQIFKLKIFLPFKNKTTHQVMENIWEGDKQIMV